MIERGLNLSTSASMIPQPSHSSSKRSSPMATQLGKGAGASLKDLTPLLNAQPSNDAIDASDLLQGTPQRTPSAASADLKSADSPTPSASASISTAAQSSTPLNRNLSQKTASESVKSSSSPVLDGSVVASTQSTSEQRPAPEVMAPRGSKNAESAGGSEGGVLLQNMSSLTKALGDLQGSLTRNVMPFARNLLASTGPIVSKASTAPPASTGANVGSSAQVRYSALGDSSSESSLVMLPKVGSEAKFEQPPSLNDYVLLSQNDFGSNDQHAATSSADQQQRQATPKRPEGSSTTVINAQRASPRLQMGQPSGPITPLVDLSLIPEHILNDDEGYPLFLFNGVRSFETNFFVKFFHVN